MPVRCRRARRTDFIELVRVLAESARPVPPADHATLKRFRRLVSDLGADLYVAVDDERPVGFVHVTYARQLATAARARIEALVVTPQARRRGTGSALLALAVERARRRGCERIDVADPPSPEARAFLAARGWPQGDTIFSLHLAVRG